MGSPLLDDELLRRCRSDPQALEEFYRRHVRRLTLYAATRCALAEDVADLVAATFVATLESADRFDPSRGEAFPWLVGIARHLAADSAHRAQREVVRRWRASLAGDHLIEMRSWSSKSGSTPHGNMPGLRGRLSG